MLKIHHTILLGFVYVWNLKLIIIISVEWTVSQYGIEDWIALGEAPLTESGKPHQLLSRCPDVCVSLWEFLGNSHTISRSLCSYSDSRDCSKSPELTHHFQTSTGGSPGSSPTSQASLVASGRDPGSVRVVMATPWEGGCARGFQPGNPLWGERPGT